VDPKQHAWLARSLIDACGGPSAAATGLSGRLAKSRLAQFQDPNAGAFMPADVIQLLEAYCGRPIYSTAIVQSNPGFAGGEGLLSEACETSEAALTLQRTARLAVLAQRPLTQAERLQLVEDANAIDQHLAAIRSRIGEAAP
jgi:hypothetical protein